MYYVYSLLLKAKVIKAFVLDDSIVNRKFRPKKNSDERKSSAREGGSAYSQEFK